MKLMIWLLPAFCITMAPRQLWQDSSRTQQDQSPELPANYYQFNGTVSATRGDDNFLEEKDAMSLPVDNLLAIVAGKADTLPVGNNFPKLADSILKKYTGTYYLSIAPQRTMIVELKEGQLQALVSETTLQLDFETATKFRFKDVVDASGEFILVNGLVTKIAVEQGGHYDWMRRQ